MTIKIDKEDGETRGRYVAIVDGHEAELTYSRYSKTGIIADHTGVPEALKGKVWARLWWLIWWPMHVKTALRLYRSAPL